MEQIVIIDEDLTFLKEHCPLLNYVEDKNIISGALVFDLTYNNVRIREKFQIEISLTSNNDSILPKVRETKGRILNVAKRKKIPAEDLHLNNHNGELCLIIPLKEKKRYPNGFELKEFIKHVEEHLYWVSFYERYEKPPWKEQAHGLDGYIQLYHEDNSYRPEVKKMIERVLNKSLSRGEFRNLIKRQTKKKKL